jgi:hypothetical protein
VIQSLSEYRTEILARLKAASDPESAQELISQVDLALMHSQMSDRSIKAFWAELRNELDGVAQSTHLLERHAAAALDAIVTAAQSAILEYELMTAADDDFKFEPER